ncbi:hypothetical protein D9V19_03115 [Listeria monocytogenes]|uniref:hypothetical protein n=1 Tax=Listeria monocytogenes TaxID=1639 RepID=UPI000EFE03A9|nr:hypothetical protein [Listeria monocytogenes]EAC6655657.1 hypothetical protein [Listeria monocytogenes]EAD6050003.1 hypothetical protein [Listeria monocytogenes]EAD6071584.1 hypothetical protein [Listeria monocytogenes]EAD6078895.1 hypothetical protein [Listeria monocytogenes]EAD6263563.1 hypothetical protein [Listeria monocytogenes]
MCEFCTSDNTTLELECVGDYAHVKLESCTNFLGDSVHCLAVEEEEGYPRFYTEIHIKYCPMCGRSLEDEEK